MLKPITLDENTLILDTETTGLGSTAEICEISIIDGLGNKRFNSLIKPINPIPEEATKIHGITNKMVEDAPTFEDIYGKLLLVIFNKNIVIYNKLYDIKMLKQVAKMCGNKYISPEPFEAAEAYGTCAMRYYSEFKNQSKWSKLTDACISMGIDITQFKAHRALEDCRMTLELIRCMNDPNYIKTVKKKEESMLVEKPQTSISEVVFDIKFTPSVINFNETEFNNSINSVIEPVKNLGDNLTKEVLTVTLANLRKFQKQISDRRITIVKDIKAPITEFETKIKKGDAEIEQYISKYDASLKVILAKEKVAKHTEIEQLLPSIIENNKLDKEHATKLNILEDYYLVKWTREKIIIDLVRRAEDLFKQQDYVRVQDELKNTQIESRTRLIEHLNAAYDMKFTYSMLPINLSNDAAVHEYYNKAQMERQHRINENAKIELAKAEEIKSRYPQTQQSVIAPEDATLKNLPDITDETNEKVNLIYAGTPSSPFFKDEEVVKINYTYQNLRLGAATQAQILSAVAKLKELGLSVEFI